MRFIKTFLLLINFIVPALASAGVLLDIRAIPGEGYTVENDGAEVTILSLSAVVDLQVFATISGVDDNFDNDTIAGVQGYILSDRKIGGSVCGNLQCPFGVSPFLADPWTTTVADLNDDGFFDIGSRSNLNEVFTLSARSQVSLPTAVDNHILGQFQYAVVSADQLATHGERIVDAVVKWNRVVFFSTINAKVDGKGVAGNNFDAYTTIGPGVQITHLVPEPSTLTILLTVTISGLFLWSRRKIQ